MREKIGPEVEVLAAVKYVPERDLPALAEAGIELVGENRGRTCSRSRRRTATCSRGTSSAQLRSRKVKDVAPHVRLIHSLASSRRCGKLEGAPRQGGAQSR